MTQLPESGSIALSHWKIQERARRAMSSQTQCTNPRSVPRNDHWMPGAADLLHPPRNAG